MQVYIYFYRNEKLNATNDLIDNIEKELKPTMVDGAGLQSYYVINPLLDPADTSVPITEAKPGPQ